MNSSSRHRSQNLFVYDLHRMLWFNTKLVGLVHGLELFTKEFYVILQQEKDFRNEAGAHTMSAEWSRLCHVSSFGHLAWGFLVCYTNTHTCTEGESNKPNTPDHIPGPLRWQKNWKRRMQGERTRRIFPAVALSIIRQNTGEPSQPSITSTATPRKELVTAGLYLEESFLCRTKYSDHTLSEPGTCHERVHSLPGYLQREQTATSHAHVHWPKTAAEDKWGGKMDVRQTEIESLNHYWI